MNSPPVRAARLCLGTAQFGFDYGITNARGRIGAPEAADMLALCHRAGVDMVDTAHGYADSERLLGQIATGDDFRIVTKTPPLAGLAPDAAAGRLSQGLDASLEHLRRTSIDALLVHDCEALLGAAGAAIWRCLETAKAAGLVARVGVSVYDGKQIDALLARFPLDIVQLPLNPLDRRLVDGGQIDRLLAAGVAIHARSLFLQGLLLAPAGAAPQGLESLAAATAALQAAYRSAGLTPLEGIFASMAAFTGIERFVVGATSLAELEAIILAADRAGGIEVALASPARPIDPDQLNPARWPTLITPAGKKDPSCRI